MKYEILVTRKDSGSWGITYNIELLVNINQVKRSRMRALVRDDHHVIILEDLTRREWIYGGPDHPEVKAVAHSEGEADKRMYELALERAHQLLDYDDELYGRWTPACIEDRVKNPP